MRKLEDWELEIKRLDKIRLELGLNYNKLQNIIGINRAQLQRFFEFKNNPSLKLYFSIKNALDEEYKSFLADLEVEIDCDCVLEDGLLKRGKIKCKKSKNEHKF